MSLKNREPNVIVRDAVPAEASLLSDLAFRSKSYWGYTAEFMEKCRKELEVTTEQIAGMQMNFGVAERRSEVLGYYSLGKMDRDRVELEALFVEPLHIGCGVGLRLLAHAKYKAAECGARIMIIQSDPNASGFYNKAGARQTGDRTSASIPGRSLPLFRLELEASS